DGRQPWRGKQGAYPEQPPGAVDGRALVVCQAGGVLALSIQLDGAFQNFAARAVRGGVDAQPRAAHSGDADRGADFEAPDAFFRGRDVGFERAVVDGQDGVGQGCIVGYAQPLDGDGCVRGDGDGASVAQAQRNEAVAAGTDGAAFRD